LVHLVYFSLIQCSNLLKGTRKTLILREIPEGDVRSLLSDRESLAPCDVAVFFYDRYTLFTKLFFWFGLAINHTLLCEPYFRQLVIEITINNLASKINNLASKIL